VFFALAFISFAVFRCFVVTRRKLRRTATSPLEHFLSIQREKLFVLPWSPRECVDAIKSKHMIDPKQMKNAPDGTHTLAPPFEIVRAHPIPAIKRNPPVLPPFLGKLVVLEVVFGRRAAGPVEREFIGPRENVGAIITDPKGNIAHQRNFAFFGIRFDLTPLLMGYPLHITEEF